MTNWKYVFASNDKVVPCLGGHCKITLWKVVELLQWVLSIMGDSDMPPSSLLKKVTPSLQKMLIPCY